MSNEAKIERLRGILREEDIPFFDEDSFVFYLAENNGDVDATAYQMLIIKSEDSTISVSGLNTQDTSKYFLRLAQKYRPNNSGQLPGSW